jgi:protein involved in polysaccharide export with SLBB domain
MSPALAAVLVLGVVVSGCSSLGQVTDAEQQQIIATAQAPKLQAGEKIRITVYNEPSLSGDFQIDPSGFVSLPLAGTVKAVRWRTGSGAARSAARTICLARSVR